MHVTPMLNSHATHNDNVEFTNKKSAKLQSIVHLCDQTNKSNEKAKLH
jgi:hypothetical protein